MRKTITYLLIIIIGIITYGCPENFEENRFWIQNQSGKDVFCYVAITANIERSCSDTLLSTKKTGEILNKDKISYRSFDSENTCDTIRVFILDLDTINKYSWKKIRQSNNILKRYDITIKDLDKMNWTVTYP